MPSTPVLQKKLLSSRLAKHLITASVFVVGWLVVSCVALAFSFVLLPTSHVNHAPVVAGAVASRDPVPKQRVGNTSAPKVSAASGMLVDPTSGEVLWASNPYIVRPLASLTKLVTVGVFLESHLSLGTTYSVPVNFDEQGISENVEPGAPVSRLHVPASSILTAHDLIFASLISSANNAAIALGSLVGTDIVQRMNLYAALHGAPTAGFVEPSGLNPENVGSAHDVILLAHAAFRWPLVADAASRKSYIIKSGKYQTAITSTDKLLGNDGYSIVAAKTGYIKEAGYNIVAQVTADGHELLLVLLGEPSSMARFTDADTLFHWAFQNFTWMNETQ